MAAGTRESISHRLKYSSEGLRLSTCGAMCEVSGYLAPAAQYGTRSVMIIVPTAQLNPLQQADCTCGAKNPQGIHFAPAVQSKTPAVLLRLRRK
jgi:hypothetical protein